MDALDILHADDWGHVVEHVEDPQDKLNLVECLPTLEEHFPDWKIHEWKVAAGLMIVAKHYQRTYFPTWTKSFMECRSVNSYFRFIIDKWLEFNSGRGVCELISSTKVEECIDYMEKNPSSKPPLIYGAVWSICDFPEVDDNRLFPITTLGRLMNLLTRIARAVKKLRLHVYHIPNYGEGSTLIQRLLTSFPNVEEVWLMFYFSHPQDLLDNNEGLEAACIPKLPKLRFLSISYFNHGHPSELILPGMMDNHLLPSVLPCPDLSQNFANLNFLALPLPLWKPEYTSKRLFIPKLRYFCLDGIKLGDSVHEQKIFNVFTKLEAPLLKELSLYFGNHLGQSAYFVKTLCLLYLKDIHPGKKCCICDDKTSFISFFVKTMGERVTWEQWADASLLHYVDLQLGTRNLYEN